MYVASKDGFECTRISVISSGLPRRDCCMSDTQPPHPHPLLNPYRVSIGGQLRPSGWVPLSRINKPTSTRCHYAVGMVQVLPSSATARRHDPRQCNGSYELARVGGGLSLLPLTGSFVWAGHMSMDADLNIARERARTLAGDCINMLGVHICTVLVSSG